MKKHKLLLLLPILLLLSGCNNADSNEISIRSAIMINQGKGNIDLINEYVEQGADLNDFDYPSAASLYKESNPFLYTYTSVGMHYGIPYYLVIKGADVNGISSHGGSSLLMNAAYNSDYEMCDFLIKQGADVNKADEKGKTAISYCISGADGVCEYDRLRTLKLLLESGAEIKDNFVSTIEADIYYNNVESVKLLAEKCMQSKTLTGLSEVIEQALFGSSERVMELMSSMSNNKASDEEWQKLVPAVLAYCGSDVTKKLVDMGYDFEAYKPNGVFSAKCYEERFSILNAARYGNTEVVKFMYENKLLPSDNDIDELLAECMRFDLNTAEYLLSVGVKPNSTSSELLDFAVQSSQYKLADLIISNVDDGKKRWVLNNALTTVFKPQNQFNPYKYYGFLEQAEYLLENGADIDTLSFYPDIEVCKWLIEHGKSAEASGENDVPLANVYENAECINYLIECGADVNLDDKSGAHSPLALAIEYGYYDSVVTLAENGAYIGDKIFSALYASERILRYLCENGADVNQVNSNGETPLEFSMKYVDILNGAPEILKQYGAK